jgi:ATP-binding cassette subfamily C protein LapB
MYWGRRVTAATEISNLAQSQAAEPAAVGGSVEPPRIPAAVILGSVVINVLALGLPLVILQIYDRILPNRATDTLAMLLIGLVVVLLLDVSMKLARAYVVAWTAARYQYEIGVAAAERLLRAPSTVVEKQPPSVHLDRLNAIDALRDFYGGQSRLLLLDLPFVLLFMLLIGLVGGRLVLVPIAVFLVFAAVTLMYGRHARAAMDERSRVDDRKHDFVVEALAGIQTVKGLAMEPQIMRRYERLQKAGAETTYRSIVLTNAAQNLGGLFANLTMVAVVAVGAISVIGGDLTIGALACSTLLSGRTVQPLLKALGLWTQLQGLSVARRRIGELLALPLPRTASAEPVANCRGSVTVRDASFARVPGEPVVLRNVTLDIGAGDIVGIRGADGSGKSTLARMIAGQSAPTSGTVAMDGCDIYGPQAEALRRWISYVPDDYAIFNGTILQNLTMFRAGDVIDAARDAARLIGLEEDIHRLPAGYDTALSAGIAEEMPAGMMQRIAIARALARPSKLLVFDEANRHLDDRGERLLREALDVLRGEKTIVLITLRPSLLKLADRVYEVTDGRVLRVAGNPSVADASVRQNAVPA